MGEFEDGVLVLMQPKHEAVCLRFSGEFSAIGSCLIAPEGFRAATRCVAVAAEQEDVPGLIRAREVTAGDGSHSDKALI